MGQFLNSHGSLVKRFEVAEAVSIPLELARDNQLTNEQADNQYLERIQSWQQIAIERVEAVLSQFECELNELGVPRNYGYAVPQEMTARLDPQVFSHAMIIVSELAAENMLDLNDAESLEMASAIDRQQLALDIMPQFLSMHAETINQWEPAPLMRA